MRLHEHWQDRAVVYLTWLATLPDTATGIDRSRLPEFAEYLQGDWDGRGADASFLRSMRKLERKFEASWLRWSPDKTPFPHVSRD